MSESDPIRVHARDGRWLVNYGSYVQGYYDTRAEAIEVAKAAAFVEGRELTIEAEAGAFASALALGSQDGDWIHGPSASSSLARPRLFFGHVDA